MIARMWKGWTKAENADNYEKLVKEVVIPKLKEINGYHGGYIFREDDKYESEFVVINFFENMEAVKKFSGPSYEIPVFEPEARRLLSKVEPIVYHYEVKSFP
jgi:heme-degrading monooxygenase HmoA